MRVEGGEQKDLLALLDDIHGCPEHGAHLGWGLGFRGWGVELRVQG